MAPGAGFLRSLSQRLTGTKAKQRRPAPTAVPTTTATVLGMTASTTIPAAEHHHHYLQQQHEQPYHHQQQCSSSSQQQQMVAVATATTNFGGGGGGAIANRHLCQCRIQLLDRTYVDIGLPKSAMAKELYERVFAHMELNEHDYFGLQFTDHFHVHHWLDPTKKIRKQMSIGPPYTFRFRVKFFSSEPANLREELTRYQFFLQLRYDIQTGRLDCSREAVVGLAALALQSEFGDFNPTEHSMEFVSEFRFHPAQDEQMERDILHSYATKCGGMSPSQAELAFLNSARLLDFYGVDMHPVEGRDGNTYRLGLTPVGMQVFDGRQKIGLFVWEKIQRLDFRGRKLTLVVEEDLEQPKCAGQLVQLHTFVFELSSHKACKHLWKCAIEYHTFYRLKYHLHNHRTGRPNRVQLFRLGSTFRHRGRTEYEALHRDEFAGVNSNRCAIPHLSSSNTAAGGGPMLNNGIGHHHHPFTRRPSQRYAPRHRLTTATTPIGCQTQPPQQKQQQQVLLTVPSTDATLLTTKCQKETPTTATTTLKATTMRMPSTNNNGTHVGDNNDAFKKNGGSTAGTTGASVVAPPRFGDSSPCRTSAIPVPSASFSSSTNSALKRSATHDNNNNNEYVTTIQISKAGRERQQSNAGEMKSAVAVSRIPSLISSSAAATAASSVSLRPSASSSFFSSSNHHHHHHPTSSSTKFDHNGNNNAAPPPPPLPSHHRKCTTQIPVIRTTTPGRRMATAAPSTIIIMPNAVADQGGMATEL